MTDHPLPLFPPDVISTFRNLCVTVPPEEVPEIRKQLNEGAQDILNTESPYCDHRLISQLYEKARLLLDRYEEFSPRQQAMIVGAIRYFLIEKDPLPDEGFATGLDDDVKVMNHVLEAIEAECGFIEIVR